MKRSILLLLLILILAAALRLYNLGVVPPGPNWDEAALGYNAYSVLKTGKDEYGTRFPLSLRSYDDYKPPLYMYITVPSVAFFGLNTWSVRLPSVVMGILAILGTVLLTRELLVYSPFLKTKRYLPYLAGLILSISPWHIQFSRIAFEANAGLTLTIWAALFFFLGIKKTRYLSVSAFFFVLTIYAYHSQRIFSPLLVLILSVVFYKELLKKWKLLFIPIIIGILTLSPLVPVLLSPTTLTRLRGTSALSDQTRLLEGDVKKLQRDKANNDRLGLILDNRRIVFARTIISGYLSHYSLNWLFISGDNARHHAPGMGLLYFVELPFLLLGIWRLATKGKKMGAILIGWMLIAPVAASPTTELPHAIRTLVFLPSLQIAVAIGILTFWDVLKRYSGSVKTTVMIVITLCVLLNLSYFAGMYFVQQDYEFSQYWQWGYKEAVAYAKLHHDEYKKIVVSTSLEQPHMFFLFFLGYDPSLYLKQGGTSSGGFAEVRNRFDIYEFRPIHWEKENHDGSILYIGKPSEIPVTPLEKISYLNGDPAILIAR
jgi:4-amino-4-deoxy-L-arabinose transferase-like glycosyltransferase